jgi:hypothetical protein
MNADKDEAEALFTGAGASPTAKAASSQRRRAAEWNHALSDILCGLIDHGLRIDFPHEHESLPWRMFPMMVEGGDGMFRLPEGCTAMPLAFSLKPSRPV